MLELECRRFQLSFFFIILMFSIYEIRLKVTKRLFRHSLQLPLGFVQQCIYKIGVKVVISMVLARLNIITV